MTAVESPALPAAVTCPRCQGEARQRVIEAGVMTGWVVYHCPRCEPKHGALVAVRPEDPPEYVARVRRVLARPCLRYPALANLEAIR